MMVCVSILFQQIKLNQDEITNFYFYLQQHFTLMLHCLLPALCRLLPSCIPDTLTVLQL